MKRIIYILLCLSIIFALLGSTVSFAEELTEEPETSVEADADANSEVIEDSTSETVPPLETTQPDAPELDVTTEDVTVQSTDTAAEEQNLFTRLYEAFDRYKGEIFATGGGGLLLALSLILKRSLKVSTKSLLTRATISDEKQTAIVSGLNEMIDGYNDIKIHSENMQTKLQEYGDRIIAVYEANCSLEKKIEDLFHVVISLMDKEITQNAEVMEVLSSVYANNKALPQGIKDFVALKRSENAKLVQEAAEITHKNEGGATNE